MIKTTIEKMKEVERARDAAMKRRGLYVKNWRYDRKENAIITTAVGDFRTRTFKTMKVGMVYRTVEGRF